MKKGNYVKGLHSPFVHGKIIAIDGPFVRLDNGGVYPKMSVKVCSAKEAKQMPDFIETLKKSRGGLNIL